MAGLFGGGGGGISALTGILGSGGSLGLGGPTPAAGGALGGISGSLTTQGQQTPSSNVAQTVVSPSGAQQQISTVGGTQPGIQSIPITSQSSSRVGNESVLANELLTGSPAATSEPTFVVSGVNTSNPGEVGLTNALLGNNTVQNGALPGGVPAQRPPEVLTLQSSDRFANTFAGSPVQTQPTPGGRLDASPNFLTVGEPPLNNAIASNTSSSRILSGAPVVVSGRPLTSPVALPPPTLNEALYGPVAPNTLWGEATTGFFQQNAEFGPNPNQTFDTVTESTVRAICNTTSQLGAILCDAYIRNPQGGVLADIGGSSIARGCVGSRYGCCDNLVTFRLNTEGSNCSQRADLVCSSTLFGCCPGTRIQRANLIGTNCPDGAVPLVGWDQNSTDGQKRAAGFGYRDPVFFGNEQEFVATAPGQTLSDNELIRLGITPTNIASNNPGFQSGVVLPSNFDVSNANNLGF